VAVPTHGTTPTPRDTMPGKEKPPAGSGGRESCCGAGSAFSLAPTPAGGLLAASGWAPAEASCVVLGTATIARRRAAARWLAATGRPVTVVERVRRVRAKAAGQCPPQA
jgi:hypothetical protein